MKVEITKQIDNTVELHLQSLINKCQSELEKQVIQQIFEKGIPLPDEAQKTIFDKDKPIAEADFYSSKKIIVFIDGQPHSLD